MQQCSDITLQAYIVKFRSFKLGFRNNLKVILTRNFHTFPITSGYYINLIVMMFYETLSNWTRHSIDKVKKTSCYHIPSFWKLQEFSLRRYGQSQISRQCIC